MIKEKYYEFLKPEFVYIPFNDRTLLNIKLNMSVLSNKYLGKLTSGENIYSSCSGRIVDLKEIETIDGKMNSMVIENDFRERRSKLVGMRRHLGNLKKQEVYSKLDEYSLNYFENKNNIIILIEYKKDIDNSDSFTLKENVDELLELLDALETILNINITVVVNSKDEVSKNILYEHIGTYPNLNMLEVNKEYNSKTYSMLTKKIYKIGETQVLILDKLYEIYFAIKKDKNLTNKIITLSYNKELINVNVKIGTKVEELLEFLNIKPKNIEFYKESKIEVSKDAIITKDLKAIIIN